MSLSYQETKEREKQVRALIDEGLSVVDIARNLSIRPETVRKFLKVRGWETHGMRDYRLAAQGGADE